MSGEKYQAPTVAHVVTSEMLSSVNCTQKMGGVEGDVDAGGARGDARKSEVRCAHLDPEEGDEGPDVAGRPVADGAGVALVVGIVLVHEREELNVRAAPQGHDAQHGARHEELHEEELGRAHEDGRDRLEQGRSEGDLLADAPQPDQVEQREDEQHGGDDLGRQDGVWQVGVAGVEMAGRDGRWGWQAGVARVGVAGGCGRRGLEEAGVAGGDDHGLGFGQVPAGGVVEEDDRRDDARRDDDEVRRDDEQRRRQAAHDEPHQHERDRAKQCIASRAAHHAHVV